VRPDLRERLSLLAEHGDRLGAGVLEIEIRVAAWEQRDRDAGSRATGSARGGTYSTSPSAPARCAPRRSGIENPASSVGTGRERTAGGAETMLGTRSSYHAQAGCRESRTQRVGARPAATFAGTLAAPGGAAER
jgi:hypothetical protein